MVDEPIFKPGEACGRAYVIDRMLTRELFAETYLALATRRSKRERALITCSRLLHAEGGPPRERLFRHDVNRLRKLGPRYVPSLVDGGIDAGIYWIATRHVEAPTVGDLNQRNANRSRAWLLGDTLSAALDVAEALCGARQVGVLHGDLTPARVLVDGLPEDRALVVTGLGHADLFRLDAQTVRASPRYRSPEQLAGVPTDERSDIYALGMLLYGWLAGAPPFAEQEPLENDQLITLAEHGRPRPLTEMGVAPSVWDLVAKMIEKDPGSRFQSWFQFIAVLSPFIEVVMLDVLAEAEARRAANIKDPDDVEVPRTSPTGTTQASGVRRKGSDESEAAGSPSSPRNSDGPRGTPRVPVAPEAPDADEVVPVTLPSVVAGAAEAHDSSSLDEASEPEERKDPSDPSDPEEPEEPDEPPPNASSAGVNEPAASGSSSRPSSRPTSGSSSRPSSRRKRAPRKARGAALGLAALFVGGLLGSVLSSSGKEPELQSLAYGAHLHVYPFALVHPLLEAPAPSAAPSASAAPPALTAVSRVTPTVTPTVMPTARIHSAPPPSPEPPPAPEPAAPAESATAQPAEKDICADFYCVKPL